MAIERTLAIMKPDCIEKNLQGEVLARIQKAGFKILGMKMIRLTPEKAGAFYEIHKERQFYKDLIAYMTSGSCVPIALERENAVAEFRKIIGATDPKKAEEGTIRKLFAESIEKNIVHGSDSVENGKIEISFFFSRFELCEK